MLKTTCCWDRQITASGQTGKEILFPVGLLAAALTVLNSCRTEMSVVPKLRAVAEEGGGELREAAPQELLTAGDEVKE